MAETIHGLSIEVRITGFVRSADGIEQRISIPLTQQFSEGSGTDQLGQWWYDQTRSLDTTSEDLDLAGSLTPVVDGSTLGLNNVKVLLLRNRDTDAGDNFLLKQGSANPATTILGGTTPTLTIGPGGFCLLVNPQGYALTAGSADTLAIQAVDTSTYEIFIAGDNA